VLAIRVRAMVVTAVNFVRRIMPFKFSYTCNVFIENLFVEGLETRGIHAKTKLLSSKVFTDHYFVFKFLILYKVTTRC